MKENVLLELPNDEMWKAFSEASLDAVSIRDDQRRLILWNENYAAEIRELCGTELAVGMAVEDYILPELLHRYESTRSDSFKTIVTEPRQAVRQFLGADGSPRWYDVRWVPIRSEGEVVAEGEICRNITKDRTFRIQAHKTSELFHEYLQLAEYPLFCYELTPPMPLSLSIDDQMKFVKVNARLVEGNEAYAKTLGYSSFDEVQGDRLGDILEHSTLANHEHLRVIGENEYKIYGFKTYAYPDGGEEPRTLWMQIMSSKEKGHLVRVWGVSRDITEQEASRVKLEVAEQKYRQLVEHVRESILIAQDGRHQLLNQRICELTGYSADDIRNNSIFECVHPDDLEMVRERYAARLRGACGDASRYEARLITKTGQVKWVQVTSTMFTWENRPALLVLLVDITEKTLAQAEVIRQKDALARMGRSASLEQMAGSITHELNQPLTGILSNAQAGEMMLENENCSTEELRSLLKDIVMDAKRAGKVIHSMRGVNRRQKEEFAGLQLNDLVESTMEMLRSEFVLKNVRVVLDLDAELPRVVGNLGQLQQVMINLISNANEAMAHGEASSRVAHVSTLLRDGMVHLFVTDSGPGIQADEVDTIFEPYATWKPGGTGLGLAICNSIVRAHGGVMSAENVSAGGARIGFSVPVDKRSEI